MDTPTRRQAEALFHALLERPPGAPLPLGEYPAPVAAEALRLLGLHQRAGDFLQPGCLPARIGPYQPIAELGSGGMGTVYLALRADPPLDRPVALKLLQPGVRLLREQQILARLDHPQIARYLDAGQSADGRDYLVMQYIAGRPLRMYWEQEQPDCRRLVRLFLALAAPLGYAHQQLVLHCDLKPANILVTGDELPVLLDFGVAAWLDHSASASGLTPEYASPEQRRGERLSTASDVYALATMLRELCPAGGRDADLEAVLDRAVAAEVAARYASVEAFAEELRHWLERRPVAARRAGLPRRAALFLRRRTTAVAFAAALALLLGVGIAGTLWQANRARRSAALAGQRAVGLRRLAATSLVQLNDAIAQLPGATASRALLIQDALGRLDQLAREADNDPATLHDLALGYAKLAQVQGAPYQPNLGQTRAALASIRRAQALFALAPQNDAGGALRADVLAGQIETRLGRYGQAIATLEDALARARRRRDADLVAAAALALGDPLLYRGDLLAASRHYADAFALRQRQLAAQPGDYDAEHAMSEAYQRRAAMFYDEGDVLARHLGLQDLARPYFAAAVADYTRARQLGGEMIAARPGSAEATRWNASVAGDQARAYAAEGRAGAAWRAASQSIAAFRALAAADPANLEAQFNLAEAYGTRALLAPEEARAAADLARAAALGEAVHRADPADAENTARLITIMGARGAQQGAAVLARELAGLHSGPAALVTGPYRWTYSSQLAWQSGHAALALADGRRALSQLPYPVVVTEAQLAAGLSRVYGPAAPPARGESGRRAGALNMRK